jgi:hypothetical protein
MDYTLTIKTTKSYLTEWERDLNNLIFNQSYQQSKINDWLNNYSPKGSINRINRILNDCVEYETNMVKTLNKSRSELKREVCILNLKINQTQKQYYQQLLKLINN